MPYLSKVMLKTPLFTRFQPKKSDENLPKPQKYFFQFFFVLKPKNWRKQIWSRIEFYNMWYVYLTFEVSWAEKSQNKEFPDFPLFLIFAQITFDQHAQCSLYSFVFINHSLYFITWRVTASKKALVSRSSCPLLDEARKILFSDKRE